MARKPNYRFERSERERLKAQKKAERAKKKQERNSTPETETESDDGAQAAPEDE